MSVGHVHQVSFFGGPCDGLEQSARQPPPMPEYLQPRGGNLDAVYRVVLPVATTTVGRDVCTKYRYEFQGYRERK